MKTIHWAVECHTPPLALRHCKKCNAQAQYRDSGLFRVNAQQKTLDIWLIYRCTRCGQTWKSTIYTHVSPRQLPEELLARFMNNDEALARQYAMDVDLLKRNGAVVGAVRCDVVGEAVDLSEPVRLVIESRHPVKPSVAKLLREQLSISKKAFDGMVDAGKISMDGNADIRRAKLDERAVVIIAP